MKLRRTLVIGARLAGLLASLGFAAACHAQSTVQGHVIDRANRPIPGLQVSVANASVGRSRAAYTDAQGHYLLGDLPASTQPYTLEVYWGTKLVHRQALAAGGRGNAQVDVQLR
jgi:Carboxypeptidase regulatory-like domain